ncbi:MAG: hypothetical protein ACK4YQ_08565 [Phenylobacterium sp.]|uniref:hypothetical protein n=1 Tax=Phenylobacterium sp. TaxID=1871053 RepID=UPI00391B7849
MDLAALFRSNSFTRALTTLGLVGTVLWSFVHMVMYGVPAGAEAPLLLTVLGWIVSEASAALKYLNGTTEGSGAKTAAMVAMAERAPPPPPLSPPRPDLDIPPAPPAT